MKLIANFLPIIILYLIATFAPEAARFMHTPLGKLSAILVILFYAKMDVISGLLVCALAIAYYQSDYVEYFSPMNKEGFEVVEVVEEIDITIDDDAIQDNGDSKDNGDSQDNEIIDFEMLPDAYPLEPKQKIFTNDNSAKQFRQKYCKNGHLVHKGQPVKSEMSEHVFPEIEQDDFHKCNICDPGCSFNILHRKMRTEEDLIKPKSSNDWFDTVWDNLRKSLRM